MKGVRAMKVVVAIDSLKGSLSSLEAGEAIKSGVLKVMPTKIRQQLHIYPYHHQTLLLLPFLL